MGQVTFSKDNITTPAPITWKRISDSVKYFLVGLMGLMATTDMVGTKTKNIIIAVSSLVIILLKSVDMGLGVAPVEQPKDV